MKLTIPKRKMQKVGKVLKKIMQKILFQYNYVLYIHSDNESGFVSSPLFHFVALFSLGILIGVDTRAGFRHAIDDAVIKFWRSTGKYTVSDDNTLALLYDGKQVCADFIVEMYVKYQIFTIL